MMYQDFHVHTNFCDGKNTPEEMIRAAIELNMKRIGLLCHSYTDFDESYCISKERIPEFINTVNCLKEKYKDKIQVLCGVEQDYFSNHPTEGFDYVLGSVHYVYKNGKYIEIDSSKTELCDAVMREYGGNWMELCRDYYKLVGDVASKTGADIIGHFDLITKFNQDDNLFSTNCDEYLEMAKAAIDKLILSGKPFEINTGAISRGYRKEAYPQKELLKYILDKGGKVILSSDSHSTDGLCTEFEQYKDYVKLKSLLYVECS